MNQTKKIRVAMIIQSYLPLVGGAERQIASLTPLLNKLDVEVHVITRRYKGLKPYEVINGAFVHRVPIVGSKAISALMYIFYSLYKIKKINPDILHAHELLSPSTIAVFGKWLFRVPILAKVLRGGQMGDIAKIKGGAISKLRINFITRNFDKFAVISHEIDNELAEIGANNTKRVFLPNGVDTERFKPVSELEKNNLRQKLNLPSGKMIIYSGRLQPEKRVGQLLNVWKQIQGQEKEAFLVILGKGSEEEYLRKLAGDSVIFCGEVDDVVPYLNASDIYVLPSATEGLSNSLLEAMACSLPIVATSVGGAPDLIENKIRGLLISPDAPHELTNAIQFLLNDEALRKQCGANAREYIIENYALPKMAQRMRNLYDELLNSYAPFL